MDHARRFQGDLVDFRHDLGRAFQGGRVGQANVKQQPPFVLRGNEAHRNPREAEARQSDQAHIEQEHDGAEPHAPRTVAV